MDMVRETQCVVKCGECGWEGRVDVRSCEKGIFLLLKCENCGAAGVCLRSSKIFERPIVISGSFLNRFVYRFLMFWVGLKNMVFRFGSFMLAKILSVKSFSRQQLYALIGIVFGVFLVVLGLVVFRRFVTHLVLAAISLISGIFTWSMSGKE
jgi:hypothetical protein